MCNGHPSCGENPSIDSLWEAYWSSNRAETARNDLIEFYIPLVRSAAIRLARQNGRRIRSGDVEDFLQHGVFGLKDAIRGFDPGRGIKFETYCARRVRGAMLDGLKQTQWLPRDIRQQVSRFSAVKEQMAVEHGSGNDHAAIAQRLGVPSESVHELHVHASQMYVNSLNYADAVEDGVTPQESIPDHREEEPAITAQRDSVRELILRRLTPSQRHLLILYYYENFTMREIAETLSLSCTRVSQLHTEIVATLREGLRARVIGQSGRPQAGLHL